MNALKLFLAAALLVSFSAGPAMANKMVDACKEDCPEAKTARDVKKCLKDKKAKSETISEACTAAHHGGKGKHEHETAAPAEGGAAPEAAPTAPAPEKQ